MLIRVKIGLQQHLLAKMYDYHQNIYNMFNVQLFQSGEISGPQHFPLLKQTSLVELFGGREREILESPHQFLEGPILPTATVAQGMELISKQHNWYPETLLHQRAGIQFHRPQLCLVVELAQDGQCLLAMTAIFWLIRFERLVMKCNESDYKSKSILGIN